MPNNKMNYNSKVKCGVSLVLESILEQCNQLQNICNIRCMKHQLFCNCIFLYIYFGTHKPLYIFKLTELRMC